MIISQVFSDFMSRQRQKGPLLQQLPTLVYLYGLSPGQQFYMKVPRSSLDHLLLNPPASTTQSPHTSSATAGGILTV